MKPPTVIVGASVAGVRLAQALRRRGHDADIVLLDREDGPPYDKPALSKGVLTGDVESGSLHLTSTGALASQGIDYEPGVEVIGIDPVRRHIQAAGGRTFPYRRLVIATGSGPITPPGLPSATDDGGLAGVHYLRTAADAAALHKALRRGRPRIVVVGGGFIGAEVAASARKLGLDVTLVEAAPRMLARGIGELAAGQAARIHHDYGVRLSFGTTVRRVLGSARVEAVELLDGSRVAADLVVVGVGTRPRTDWLAESGLPIADGVRCDEYLRVVGVDDVWAIGDVARWSHARLGREVRREHWTNARDHASAVAAMLTTGQLVPVTPVSYVWSDQYDVHIQHVGEVTDDVSERAVDGGVVYEYQKDGRLSGMTGFNAQRSILETRMALGRAGEATAPARKTVHP
jgi:3-phenylpropionate/trans-cinnamate dioxygenase ferredoxin reductase subunit